METAISCVINYKGDSSMAASKSRRRKSLCLSNSLGKVDQRFCSQIPAFETRILMSVFLC